jgi:hypothetical protein
MQCMPDPVPSAPQRTRLSTESGVLELSFTEPEQPHWPASDAHEDHFEPPEPAPLPIPRTRTVGGVLTIIVGVLLLALPNVVDLGERVATPLGLLAVTAGIGWLVTGLRSDAAPQGPDDGAQL